MNTQTVQDIVVIAGMFFLWIGLLVLLTLGLGYLHQYRQRPAATLRDEADHVAQCRSASVLASVDPSQAG